MSDPKITRRQLIGGAAAGAALGVACRRDYFAQSESQLNGDEQIVRAVIHPGIGVARVGNSAEGFFIGPEVVEPTITEVGQSRDGAGALKRQAARFRIYGYNAQGQIVREITGDNADVDWFVQLANKKAAWYRFIAAMDLPESSTLKCIRRNAGVTDRASLVAGGGTKTIKGKSISGPAYRFDTRLFGAPVSLGEVRTDEHGRLLVLGGLGKAGSPENKPIYDPRDGDSFNNADGWWDDIADGPVSAVVRLGGRQIPVEPAWVIVGPPNYAPDVIGWRTMHDLLVDTFVDAGMLALPATTSFTKDVLPALRRLSNLQWVNRGFSEGYRKGVQFDFDDATSIANLNRRDADNKGFREQIRSSFRPPGKARRDWPWIYGDAFGTFDQSPAVDLSVGHLRSLHLERWANGDFIDDWDPTAKPLRALEQVPLGEQPAMLDMAALHFCLADAFHPGCELTWPMRHATMYSAPFRVKRRQESDKEPDYGPELTQAIALGPNGPLHAQAAGDLTRWMAMPWHGDTIFCRSGYEPQYDPYLPTFWPARVPNHVLTAEDYATAMNTSLPREQRLAAFRNRASWVRRMTGGPPAQMMQMVREWDLLGVVEARPGPASDPDLPAQMFVESLPPSVRGSGGSVPLGETAPPGSAASAAQQAGWDDEAQLEAFRQIRIRRPQ
ncbi:MAG: LodA/GoxA family CTQ-dependent oxidase [Labilithrix sp.]|nr:LodA/GoxA family CTQ-dependent oxidase [Labilithrix sp.]MCW5810412.1 LodA/GoxA family CTQ-dependent oxidase [Labilithrix sp.]